MYNRYIPQKDGSFRRIRAVSPQPQTIRQAPPSPAAGPSSQAPHIENKPESNAEPAPEAPCSARASQETCIHNTQSRVPPRPPCRPQSQSPLQFFRQLLPRDFDTEDLLVVLLLLLMCGDAKQDSNHALLTLVLYLFL